MAASFDHEEVGSLSAEGADSNTLPSVVDKVFTYLKVPAEQQRDIFSRSLLLSADMSHALHPNYAEKHQTEHKVTMNEGIVLKYNHNQRYATNAQSAALVREFCKRQGVPVQNFVVRNDCPCGSTVGPMLSAKMGVRTVDVGPTQWSMHSCRETAASDDLHYLKGMCEGFYKYFREVDNTISTL